MEGNKNSIFISFHRRTFIVYKAVKGKQERICSATVINPSILTIVHLPKSNPIIYLQWK